MLYDVSSSYFEGRSCPLAKLGCSRDGRCGTLQIIYGLLCDRGGARSRSRSYPACTDRQLVTTPDTGQAITSTRQILTWELGGGLATSQSCELDGQPIACSGTSITVAGLSYDVHTLAVTVTGGGGTCTAKFSWRISDPTIYARPVALVAATARACTAPTRPARATVGVLASRPPGHL